MVVLTFYLNNPTVQELTRHQRFSLRQSDTHLLKQTVHLFSLHQRLNDKFCCSLNMLKPPDDHT